jgi:hypothetical protein
MSIRIFPKNKQGYGAFNGGEIVENKPIGFPQDHSEIRPYSNLFYWAHARAVTDSTIGLHPHQGFEICSFVLNGEIRHHDTKLKEWRSLKAGDVQIIRAGNGISHSEFMAQDAEMFQIWFDPNLQKTLSQPASYDDYAASTFPVSDLGNGGKLTTVAGEGSPFTMDTPGIEVLRISLPADQAYSLQLDDSAMASLYVLKGTANINGEQVAVSDFVLSGDASALAIEAETEVEVFVILSPRETDYPTYMQLRRAEMN